MRGSEICLIGLGAENTVKKIRKDQPYSRSMLKISLQTPGLLSGLESSMVGQRYPAETGESGRVEDRPGRADDQAPDGSPGAPF